MYGSGICDTKTTDISETKQSRAETWVRSIGWWQIWRHRVNFGLLFRGAKFFYDGYLALFVGERRNLATLGVWQIDTYSQNLVNFGLLFQRIKNFWQPISGTLFIRARRHLVTLGV